MVALIPHPHSKGDAVRSIDVALQRSRSGFRLTYIVSGDLVRIHFPPASPSPGRRDELWRSTCFEAFFRGEGERYTELNFSPSLDYAAYAFDEYRQGMTPVAIATAITRETRANLFALDVRFAVTLQDSDRLCLSAIIEQEDGAKSYWALKHPDGPPDFHHPSCFAVALADIAKP